MERSWGRNNVISTVVSVTNVEKVLFEDIPMEEVAELAVQITDAGAATSTCTIKVYGSIDGGATYHQIYTYLGTANIHDGSAAAATQTTATSPIMIYTEKVFPLMKITATRGAASPADVTTTAKISRVY